MVPIKPAFTVTGSFSEFRASAFNFKSFRTTSPVNLRKDMSVESYGKEKHQPLFWKKGHISESF